jgi:hypothetical protein
LKKYLDIREESNLAFSQLVQWFLELPVVQQKKTKASTVLAGTLRYNPVDIADGREAFRKLEESLQYE